MHERQALVVQPARVDRRAEVHRVDEHLPARIRTVDAADQLDERRLARAVLPHERMDLTRSEGEARVVEHGHAREGLRQSPHLQARDRVARRRGSTDDRRGDGRGLGVAHRTGLQEWQLSDVTAITSMTVVALTRHTVHLMVQVIAIRTARHGPGQTPLGPPCCRRGLAVDPPLVGLGVTASTATPPPPAPPPPTPSSCSATGRPHRRSCPPRPRRGSAPVERPAGHRRSRGPLPTDASRGRRSAATPTAMVAGSFPVSSGRPMGHWMRAIAAAG